MNNRDWDDLGRNIQDIVDRAVNSQDYQKLDQTIRQVIDRAVNLGGEAVRKVRDTSGSTTAGTVRQNARVTVESTRNLPALYGSTGGKMAVGILKIVGGGLLALTALGGLIASAIVSLVTGAGFLGPVWFLGAGGASAWLISSGVLRLNWVSRFKSYRKTLGQKTYCTLEKLARSVGKSVKFVRKELQGMIDQGLFLEGHMDKEGTQLITSDETYRYYEQSRLQLEQRQQAEAEKRQLEAAKQPEQPPMDTHVKEVLDRGIAFISEIRRCNDAIPGEEISEKISRMENIVQRIFQRAEAHPEIVPDLKKMMDYYLPMTVKLLNAYADMDAQPIQGETIARSKREIEATLDTLNLAFEKLLDDLFADTALEVSSDISVLNTLLAQEGLKDDELTKMKKQQSIELTQ